MSHTSLWYEIKKYCDVIPDYALAFKFAKGKKCFNLVFPKFKEDILQEIAICCLEANTIKELGNLLSKRIYNFYHHIIKEWHIPEKKDHPKYQKKARPGYLNHCDICGRNVNEYMYKNFFPGETVCKRCYRAHRRKYDFVFREKTKKWAKEGHQRRKKRKLKNDNCII